jgi:hypothetical protein
MSQKKEWTCLYCHCETAQMCLVGAKDCTCMITDFSGPRCIDCARIGCFRCGVPFSVTHPKQLWNEMATCTYCGMDHAYGTVDEE